MEDEDGYTALRFQGRTKPKDEGEARLQAEPQCPPWQRRMLWMSGSLNVLLMLAVIGCGVWIAKGSTQGNSKHELCSNSGFSFERIALTSEGLKDHLCGESHESKCEICPYKWVMSRGRCYFLSEGFRSWDSSRDYCRSRKGDLITLEDTNNIDFLEEIEKSGSYLWIGLKSNEITGEWKWLNGSRLQEGSIAVKSRSPGHTCGAYSGKEIYPELCSSKKQWVCEKEAIQFDKR